MKETPDHADIYRRVEKVEIDVAVLDSKTNRLHEDLVDMKGDMKLLTVHVHENSIIARRLDDKISSFPKTVAIIVSIATLALGALSFLNSST